MCNQARLLKQREAELKERMRVALENDTSHTRRLSQN